MLFRKTVLKNKSNEDKKTYPVFVHVNDIIRVTLCQQNNAEELNEIKCLNRDCDKCGIGKLELKQEELDLSDGSVNVKWEQYEYTNISGKGGKTCRKLQLMTKKQNLELCFSIF